MSLSFSSPKTATTLGRCSMSTLHCALKRRHVGGDGYIRGQVEHRRGAVELGIDERMAVGHRTRERIPAGMDVVEDRGGRGRILREDKTGVQQGRGKKKYKRIPLGVRSCARSGSGFHRRSAILTHFSFGCGLGMSDDERLFSEENHATIHSCVYTYRRNAVSGVN